MTLRTLATVAYTILATLACALAWRLLVLAWVERVLR
jgi:hypothetical protein